MAMIKCPECNNDISDTAKKCIHCGYRFTNSEEHKKLVKTIIISVVSLIVIIAAIVTIVLIVNKRNEDRKKRELEEAERQRIREEKRKEKEYREQYRDIVYDILDGAADTESCGNMISNVWYNTIWEKDDAETDMYTKNNGVFYDDFNDALRAYFDSDAYNDYATTIRQYKTDAGSAIIKMSDYPSKYADSYNALKDLYDEFVSFSSFCLSPSGSYTTYSANFAAGDSSLMSRYNKAKLYDDEFKNQ